MSNPVAGWYHDPSNPSLQRYWDGNQWTTYTQPLPASFNATTPQQTGQYAPPNTSQTSLPNPYTAQQPTQAQQPLYGNTTPYAGGNEDLQTSAYLYGSPQQHPQPVSYLNNNYDPSHSVKEKTTKKTNTSLLTGIISAGLVVLLSTAFGINSLSSSDTSSENTTGSQTEQNANNSEDNSTGGNSSDTSNSSGLTTPGSTVGLNEWATVSTINYNDEEVTIQIRLASVEPLSDTEWDYVKTLNSSIDDYTYKSFINMEMRQVSGNMTSNGVYTFSPVDAQGNDVYSIMVFSWDACPNEYFTSSDTSETITTCVLAVSDTEQPAGAYYYGWDTEYDLYSGKPVYFIDK